MKGTLTHPCLHKMLDLFNVQLRFEPPQIAQLELLENTSIESETTRSKPTQIIL